LNTVGWSGVALGEPLVGGVADPLEWVAAVPAAAADRVVILDLWRGGVAMAADEDEPELEKGLCGIGAVGWDVLAAEVVGGRVGVNESPLDYAEPAFRGSLEAMWPA
jgi:hypothetical protein